jgi:3-deoxy-D-manno-octulosonate 8-phosphate phosphatase (KDO 8-P phosphatase)
MKFKVLILDVDGVMTTGHFLYSEEGKCLKIFGPDDNDALRLLSSHIEIRFVTGDRKGFLISNKRISEDMDFALDLVSTVKRIDWVKKRYDPKQVIYMGDGIFDHYVMREVGYSIAPKNADRIAKSYANYVTDRAGGDRAVAEACLHIMEKFFVPFDPNDLPADKLNIGEWTA